MDKTALVSLDIERGREVLDALERTKLKMAIALWVYSSEYEDWRLVLSARQFDSPDPRDAYRRLNETLAAAGLTPARTPPDPTGCAKERSSRRAISSPNSWRGFVLFNEGHAFSLSHGN